MEQSTRKTRPFLSVRLSFLSPFHLDVPLSMPLEADEKAPSFSFCLRATTDALFKAFCLAASIFAKGKK